MNKTSFIKQSRTLVAITTIEEEVIGDGAK